MHMNVDPLLESIQFLLQIKDCSVSEIPSFETLPLKPEKIVTGNQS